MVTLADYQVPAGQTAGAFGIDGLDAGAGLQELNKALSAGEVTGRDTANLTTASGAPLKVESLEKNLKIITHGAQDVTLWKAVPKAPAYNTVEEYNQLSSYGQDRGGFNLEGELPTEEDSVYIRRAQLVKFLGVTKSVTHPMQLVNTMVGNVVQREIKNGTLWILRKLDRALYFGDSSVVSEEFNGYYTQHRDNDAFADLNAYYSSEVVVDLRGGPLTETAIQNASNGIVTNFGMGNALFASNKTLNDFVEGFYGNKYINPNTPQTTNATMGQRVQTFASQFGDISLNYDIFASSASWIAGDAAAVGGANAPVTPSAGGAVTPVATDASASWAASDAGDYFYGVTLENRFGRSAMYILEATTSTIVAGGAVDLTFTVPASSGASGMTFYRGLKNAAAAVANNKYYPIFSIGLAAKTAGYDGAAAASVRDRNRLMPNTDQAFLIENSDEVWSFKQLAPLMKMDLAVTSPAYRFMILHYGTPQLYAPKKMTKFINIRK